MLAIEPSFALDLYFGYSQMTRRQLKKCIKSVSGLYSTHKIEIIQSILKERKNCIISSMYKPENFDTLLKKFKDMKTKDLFELYCQLILAINVLDGWDVEECLDNYQVIHYLIF